MLHYATQKRTVLASLQFFFHGYYARAVPVLVTFITRYVVLL